MSQNDLNIANQTASATRADINSALQALGSNNSGSSAPTTTYANMHWYDTSSNILKQRSEADDAWISIGYFDQSTNSFKILDDTMVVNTSGTQTGLLGDQSTATWQAGTGTTQSLVSPANVKSAIDNLTPSSPIRAFANFNGNGTGSGTPAIGYSEGISSIVRNNTGDFTVTFNTGLMPDANYVLLGTGTAARADNRGSLEGYSQAQNTCRFTVTNHGNLFRSQMDVINVAFIR